MDFHDFTKSLKIAFYKEGLVEVLKQLLSKFNEKSSKFNTLLLIHSEHKKLDDNIIKGIIEYEKEKIHLAQIRGRLLKFIDSLESNDLILKKEKPKNKIEVGFKDFPSQVLVVMGKMTPEIAKSRLKEFGAILLLQAKNFKNVEEKKEVKGAKAKKKLEALKKINSKDIKLYKKYVKKFVDAFKPLSNETQKIAEVINSTREEFAILVLYQVESAFSKGTLDKIELNGLLEDINSMINECEELISILDESIESEKLILLQLGDRAKKYGFKRGIKKSFTSQILLKDSFFQFNQQLDIVKKGVLTYLDNPNWEH